jgi:sugar lactone lactonase YvrE
MAAIREIVVFNMGEIAATPAAGVNVTKVNLDKKAIIGTLNLTKFDVRVSTNSAFGMTVDKSGNIYISDYAANMVYKMTEGGKINHLAGVGGAAGNNKSLQKVAGTLAKFNGPLGLACDNTGNIYVADRNNNQVRKITDGYVSVLAGNGSQTAGLVDASANPLQAQFNNPIDVAVDNAGNVIVADIGTGAIRRITGGQVLTLCGGASCDLQNVKASKIAGSNMFFSNLNSVTVDANGNIFACDSGNKNIKKITPNGWVYLFSGSGATGKSLGTAATLTVPAKKAYTCSYQDPFLVRCSRDGYVYVLDGGVSSGIGYTSRLVKLTPNGVPSNIVEFHNATAANQSGAVRAFAISPANKLFVAVVHT